MQEEESHSKERTELKRRAFLGSTALLTLPLLATAQSALPAGALGMQEETDTRGPGAPGLIIRQRDPENLEFPSLLWTGFSPPMIASISATTLPFPHWRPAPGGCASKARSAGRWS